MKEFSMTHLISIFESKNNVIFEGKDRSNMISFAEFVVRENHKLNKNVKGYLCPRDFYKGNVKEGELFVICANESAYISEKTPTNSCGFAMPCEIVETWEMVLK
jgi:hypothetical protein